MISNMQAIPVLRRRVVVASDAFVEMVIWRVPDSVESSAHFFKNRLAYVVEGLCVLRYDNERGKGDHGISLESKAPMSFEVLTNWSPTSNPI